MNNVKESPMGKPSINTPMQSHVKRSIPGSTVKSEEVYIETNPFSLKKLTLSHSNSISSPHFLTVNDLKSKASSPSADLTPRFTDATPRFLQTYNDNSLLISDDTYNSVLELSGTPDDNQIRKMLKDSFMTVTQIDL